MMWSLFIVFCLIGSGCLISPVTALCANNDHHCFVQLLVSSDFAFEYSYTIALNECLPSSSNSSFYLTLGGNEENIFEHIHDGVHCDGNPINILRHSLTVDDRCICANCAADDSLGKSRLATAISNGAELRLFSETLSLQHFTSKSKVMGHGVKMLYKSSPYRSNDHDCISILQMRKRKCIPDLFSEYFLSSNDQGMCMQRNYIDDTYNT